MNKESFEYGGYHFIPERCFTKEENNFFAISRRQRIDKELGFCRPGYSYESKYPYSHEDFYAASPDKECDLFRCVENGRLYVFVNRKCEQKGPKKVSTFSTRFHVVSNVFPKYQMLTF